MTTILKQFEYFLCNALFDFALFVEVIGTSEFHASWKRLESYLYLQTCIYRLSELWYRPCLLFSKLRAKRSSGTDDLFFFF